MSLNRLSQNWGPVQVAIVVADSFQGRGVGSALASHLVEAALRLRLNRLVAFVLLENRQMQAILERLGFTFGAIGMGCIREGQLLLARASGKSCFNEVKRAA